MRLSPRKTHEIADWRDGSRDTRQMDRARPWPWLALALALLCPYALAAEPTVAERLGHPADTKLLIIHADDIGMSRSVNAASLEAARRGIVNSGSMMAPSPWFGAAARVARENPELDWGLHLTLTSEWRDYRWPSLSGAGPGHSLHDRLGFQHRDVRAVVKHASPEDVATEIQRQIDSARGHGVEPTHLDSHMGTLFASEAFFAAYVEAGRRNRLPILLPREAMLAGRPDLTSVLEPGEALVDRIFMADPSVAVDRWDAWYDDIIENLEPGVTQIVVHVGYDNAELQAITVDHPDFGSAWRQRDLDYFTSPRARELLRRNDIVLVDWRTLGELVYPDSAGIREAP